MKALFMRILRSSATVRRAVCVKKLAGGSAGSILTYQTFCRGSIDLAPHYFYAYLQLELSGYDAWFNVKDDNLIFGTAVREPDTVKCLHKNFIKYMEREHRLAIDSTLRFERWITPRVNPGCPLVLYTGNILFAGEAAGFLNPMGEGMSAAMESGYAAARAIIEAGKKDSSLNPDTEKPHTLYTETQYKLRDKIECLEGE